MAATESELSQTVEISGADLHAFIRFRRGAGDRLYGVVDAARDRELALAARERFNQRLRWLFSDDTGDHMADVAPYVVPISYQARYPFLHSGYLDLWAERLGTSAGILILTELPLERLVVRLRNVFRATDPDGHRFYFRFYDPRVLRLFLTTCTGTEAGELFRSVQRILVESQRPGRMLSCSHESGGVRVDEVDLKPVRPNPYKR